MLPDIQLDSKRRQELVALLGLHLQLLKLLRLKLETARRTTKKNVSEVLSKTDQPRTENQGRIPE